LSKLRKKCGGWVYWNNERRTVIFATDSEWKDICARQEVAQREALQEGVRRTLRDLDSTLKPR
jgi:hypothetical protein